MKGTHSITKIILNGLAVILPITIIGFILYWLVTSLENALAQIFRFLLPPYLHFPGKGIVVSLLLAYVVGLMMNSRMAQNLFGRWENMLQRIPLIKTLYGSLQDIIESFSPEKRKRFNRVVAVTLKDSGLRLIGYVTREDLSSLPVNIGGADTVAVYLPMSYQIGGYMVLVPRSMLEPVDLSVEDASRLVFTAGMSMGKHEA